MSNERYNVGGYRYVECPLCSTEQPYSWAYLGTMGDLDHFKCRGCGTSFDEPTYNGESL